MDKNIQNENAVKRFLKYVSVDTTSSETSGLSPSTEKQKVLGRMLRDELTDIGAESVYYDEEHNYVYAVIPATDGGKSNRMLGFISHMDTSPETSGENVKPQFVYDYDGTDITLGAEYVLSPSKFPELLHYIGKTLITTDGSTLLGADDKAGIAEIMTMAEILLDDMKRETPKYIHGRIAVAFTPERR